MRTTLKWVTALQVICFVLWLQHSSYLKSVYGEERFRRGVESGMIESRSNLAAEGIKFQTPLGDVPNKDRIISADFEDLFHYLVIFWPACILQCTVIIILIICLFRAEDKSEQDTEAISLPDE